MKYISRERGQKKNYIPYLKHKIKRAIPLFHNPANSAGRAEIKAVKKVLSVVYERAVGNYSCLSLPTNRAICEEISFLMLGRRTKKRGIALKVNSFI